MELLEPDGIDELIAMFSRINEVGLDPGQLILVSDITECLDRLATAHALVLVLVELGRV
jgi:hypothetical protein